MIWRIYTENVNLDEIIRSASLRFPGGFTVFKGLGYWKDKVELSVCLEIVELDRNKVMDTELVVHSLAETIRAANGQDAVLVVSIPATATLIESLAPKKPLLDVNGIARAASAREARGK